MTGMTDQKPIEVVSATRLSRADFICSAPRSACRCSGWPTRRYHQHCVPEPVGLPAVYNHRLAQSRRGSAVVCPDDVWIDDIYLADRLLQACAAFDVVGVVEATPIAGTPGIVGVYR